ncbi:MAG: response regulator transcription factor [Hyphomicrobiaceae bacterium]|nr:response regulator transcription factor [Hyphomicrobiaceae bacterium]
MKILLVEDQPILADAISRRLHREGHATDHAASVKAARKVLATSNPQFVLLDLGLPDGDGVSLLSELRAAGFERPIIVLTARDQVADCIDVLKAGADDFLTKPFNLGVLVARIEAVRRRYLGKPATKLMFGDLTLDTSANRVWKGAEELRLTLREWTILLLLADGAQSFVSKEDIEQALYRSGHQVKSNTVEVYVSRLRRKLGTTNIETAHGRGYRLRESAK